MSANIVKITNDLVIEDVNKYLIICDSDIFAYFDSEVTAQAGLKSLVDTMVKEACAELGSSCKVFVESLLDRTNILTQQLGYVYDGTVSVRHSLHIRPVQRAILITPLTKTNENFPRLKSIVEEVAENKKYQIPRLPTKQ